MNKYGKTFLNIFLAVLLAVVQLSFVNNLPSYFHFLNAVLVCLIFVLALSGFARAWWWALGIGFIFDIYYFVPFGINTLGYAFVVVIGYALFHFVFTDRSLYSFLATVFLTTIFDDILTGVSSYLIYLVSGHQFVWSIFTFSFWKTEIAEVVLNMILVFLLFHLINSITRRLQPVFLINKR